MTTEEYLDIYHKYPAEHNQYEGWEEDLEKIKEYNKELTNKYPWLLPHNRWTGNIIENYDYTYTELDDMPWGWRIAFGDQMCEEIHNELVKFNYVDEYMIVQIKEKYGGLRWYDNGTPIGDMSEDYEELVLDDWGKYKCAEDEFVICKGKIENNKYMYHKYKILDKCKITDIIRKYADISYNTCIKCGKPAEYMSIDWISPFCSECAHESKYFDTDFEPIEKVEE